ncbi:ankyrin repeat protein [Apiospora marii]|uniref:Ankyrin repeat protein n=1 Tax=Apiospora marii TaxID=335849 RepID=A0ABR1RIT8_9PEZI
MAGCSALARRWKRWKERRSRAEGAIPQPVLSNSPNQQDLSDHVQPAESAVTSHSVLAGTAPTAQQTDSSPIVPAQNVPTPANTNPDVWVSAYEMFVKENPDLAKAYHEHLSTICTSDGSTTTDLAVNRMSPNWTKSIVDKLLEKRLGEQWHIELGSKDIKVRVQAEKLAKLFVWCNGVVKDALSAQPYAALAWSGVSILFPLLTTATAQHEAMVVGFESAHHLLVYWRASQDLLPDDISVSGSPALWDGLIDLYSHIFEFQARVVCHLSKAPLPRAWEKITGEDDWKTMASDLTKRSERCKSCTDDIHRKKAQDTFESQLRQMHESQAAIRQIYDLMEREYKQRRKDLTDQRETKLLKDLASDHEGRKNLVPAKVKGTCTWFVEDSKFREWRDGTESGLLWVSAGPGCGKSVLTRSLIDERQLSTSPATTIICHFFFKDGNSDATHSYDALSALVHQVFIGDLTGQCIGGALTRHKNFGEKLRTMSTDLWDILLDSASTQGSGEIICVLDALDECMKGERDFIIGKLQDFFSDSRATVRHKCRLKFLVTSRPYDDIERPIKKMYNLSFLRVDGDENVAAISEDINLIIDHKINEQLGHLSDDVCQRISERLKAMNNRTYLWLRLTFEIVKANPGAYDRPKDLDKLLDRLPTKHADAYDELLKLKHDPTHTPNLLGILLAATQPLSIREVNCALAYADETNTSAVELWPEDSVKEKVENYSGLLATVYNSEVSFIHQTVRGFLTGETEETSADGKWDWRGRFKIPECHHVMSLSCIRYLSRPEFISPIDPSEFPLFGYANCNWPFHYRGQGDEQRSILLKEARDLCRHNKRWMTIKKDFMIQDIYYGANYVGPNWSECPDLIVAAYDGLDPVVRSIMKEPDVVIDAYWKGLGTALRAACFEGHHDVVTTLLQHGARVNFEKLSDQSLTRRATKPGRKRYVHGIRRVTNEESKSQSPIGTAIRHGHVAVIKLFLDERGEEVIITEEDITSAARGIYRDKIMPVLFQARGNKIITRKVFVKALSYGDKELIALLLERCISLLFAKQEDRIKITHDFLRFAARNSDHGGEIVRFLFKKLGDQLQITDHVLQAALENTGTSKEVLVCLLERKPELLEVRFEDGQTPLHIAARCGNFDVAEMLLNKGLECDIKDKEGNTPLLLCTFDCGRRTDLSVIKLLLKKGADWRIPRNDGQTPLISASLDYHDLGGMVPLLLENGADPNAQSLYHGWTPLHAASSGGNLRTVQLLLDKGADRNVADDNGQLPWDIASCNGHEKVVSLLKKGAN